MKEVKITDCLDLLAGFEFMNINEQKQIFLLAIDTLCGYPKPQKKGENIIVEPKILGAYMFVSNARNACRLGELELIEPAKAYFLIEDNLTNALSLLLA